MPGDLSAGHRARTATSTGGTSTTWSALGAQGIYVSMFDEYNEGNQIAKTAENASHAMPTNSGIRALDEDGTACSSDYYLRITADGGRMLKGQIALTATRPDPAGRRRPDRPPPTGDRACGPGPTTATSRADNAGASPLIANRTAVGTWEQFDLVDPGGGNIALRARVNSRTSAPRTPAPPR